MGYLNSLPGICIRGENYDALVHLCNFYRAAKRTKGEARPTSMKTVHPWYGVDSIEIDAVRDAVRKTFTETILNPPDDARVIGFKEIRVGAEWIPDLDAFLADLVEIFGDVCFLFNHRDIGATARSSWWTNTNHSYSTIRGMDRRLRENSFTSAPNAFHVEYEELIAGPEHARKLAEFLGVPFDPEAYRVVMARRHSY
jgi:hypothetical protein